MVFGIPTELFKGMNKVAESFLVEKEKVKRDLPGRFRESAALEGGLSKNLQGLSFPSRISYRSRQLLEAANY